MISFIVFLLIIVILLSTGYLTKEKGFKKLSVHRQLDRESIVEGEQFKISVIVENKKRLPIFFMLVREEIPYEIMQKSYSNITQYSVGSYERVKKTYTLPIGKRGVYLLRNMEVVVGDIFGFFTIQSEIEDYKELVVYPKVVNIKRIKFESTSYQGDVVVKRWIYEDPMYIKGIREYGVEDRMKDIHWKSSLKMNKLMVKEYDYTSEREFIIILNLQCEDPYWRYVNEDCIDNGIKSTLSIADGASREGMKVSMWTNANLISYSKKIKGETQASNSIKNILEVCARIDYMAKISFSDYLEQRMRNFNKNNTYVIITSFLSDKDLNLIIKLRNVGINLKIIDVSTTKNIPNIRGIERMEYGGEVN